MKTQNGSAQAIVIAAAVLVVVGLLGFVFWQNFMQKESDSNTSNVETSNSTTENTNNTDPKESDDNVNYVTLDVWNVKFKAPTDGSTVKWAVRHSGSSNIGFTTSNLTDDNEMCSAENAAAGSLERSEDPISPPTAGATMIMVNGGEPINGYYYAFTLPNGSHCDNQNPSDYDEANKIQDLVVDSLAAY